MPNGTVAKKGVIDHPVDNGRQPSRRDDVRHPWVP